METVFIAISADGECISGRTDDDDTAHEIVTLMGSKCEAMPEEFVKMMAQMSKMLTR